MTKKIKIMIDDDVESPRALDNLGKMVCWHRHYILGDEMPREDPKEWMKENVPEGSVVLPLFLYDHSGITMRTYPFECPWDSGQVGWIFCTPEKIREEYGKKRITKKLREKVSDVLRSEVKVYDQYLRGSCWGYEVEKDGEVEDSCWGFFGDDLEETGILCYLGTYPRELIEKAWEARYQ